LTRNKCDSACSNITDTGVQTISNTVSQIQWYAINLLFSWSIYEDKHVNHMYFDTIICASSSRYKCHQESYGVALKQICLLCYETPSTVSLDYEAFDTRVFECQRPDSRIGSDLATTKQRALLPWQ